ncbi:hypothetical protein H6F44_10625 [Pseudanabaena sp. FACHB-1277]|uniref:Uncharacterized protein n=1 Tax=Pseudanabaena cinerea FACHB-1277 TaxID=2949581 RepID=A0A926UTM7_9CYAN|nr:hypothetical protein [Pseudanabaena cinerea]MBD2150571.1 hypothetical protein [Pseudanabaena cinerea FACHB-1277]
MEVITPILAAIKIIVDSGVLSKVGDGAIAKVGENSVDFVSNLAQRLWYVLVQKAPDTKKWGTGKEIDYQQAVIDVEAIASDPEVAKLLDEVRSLLSSNQELAAKVEALQKQIEQLTNTANNPQSTQVALEYFEAGELEGEIRQEKPQSDRQQNTEQVAARNVKVAGKAVITINQKIN